LYDLNRKIGLVSLGCPKNLVDSELMLGALKGHGYEIVVETREAQIIIVNTCGFIESAKQESINTIIEMAAYKEQSCELLIVTGCLAQRYKQTILEEIPEVDAVLGTGSYSKITSIINEAYKGQHPSIYGELDGTDYFEGERILSTGRGFAYLKIAEGCDNCCTYCVIPSLRGKFRSRKKEEILKEAAKLAASGVREVILVAQDTTRYGLDIYGEKKLVELIRGLSCMDGIGWIRLLYCYPEEIDNLLIEEIANNDKVCKYLDIPIQHASDSILKRMARRGSSKEVEMLLEELRNRINGLIIRTSLIVGFPGETEEDFNKLTAFIEKYKFDRLGVFMYSKEDGTPAALMKDQIPAGIKKSRHSRLMSLQQQISSKSNSSRLGKEYKVLVEGVAEDGIFYFGRSYAEAPDIDGLVYFTSVEPLETGMMVTVKILNSDQYDLTGEVKNESAQ
jgi:ribosomal protein S12 methylthiotransferase